MNIPKLLADYETRLIKDRLMEFPQEVKNQKAEIRTIRELHKELVEQLAVLEADLLVDIAAEINGNGKPKFSNDKARQAELTRRKAADEEYKELSKQAKEKEFHLEEAQDELARLQDEYKSYRYIARIIAEELAVWANVEESEEGVQYQEPQEKIVSGGQAY